MSNERLKENVFVDAIDERVIMTPGISVSEYSVSVPFQEDSKKAK